ncbi:MAG: sulfatase-like hydrolase/transferase, partial [Armatimonadetes bacterium]|nr:sulfatase-like hydrolase/transferase [Armatimonadota bacterium]
ILLITSDQQHFSTLGVLNPEISTPNLDRLASQGMLFERAYCPNPTCTPTRASLITGRYPSQHGAYSLGTKLMEGEHTIGEDLGAAGYRTALVGKAHFQPLRGTDEFPSLESYPIMQDLDFWRDFHGPFYGFDHVELARNHTDEAHVGQHYAIWMEENGLDNWRDYFRTPTGNNDDQVRTWEIPERYHYDAWIAERTNALMEEYTQAGESFFAWASFFDPHPKYLVPRPWDTMYDPAQLTVPQVTPGEHDKNPPHFQLTQQRNPDFSDWRVSGQGLHGFHCHLRDRDELAKDIAIYYAMVSLMDKYIGSLLDKLDELGQADNTLVIFTTDHGHFFGQHGLIAKGPFHYEDMIRVPLIARMPGRIPAGVRSPALQSLVDLPQTIFSFAGIDAPMGMTGVDQSAVWTGEAEAARDHVVVENRHEPDTIHVKTYVDARYKLTVYYNRPYGELFDLQEDPGEVNNLWDDPAAQDLKHELVMKLLFAEMGKEPLPMPRIWGA